MTEDLIDSEVRRSKLLSGENTVCCRTPGSRSFSASLTHMSSSVALSGDTMHYSTQFVCESTKKWARNENCSATVWLKATERQELRHISEEDSDAPLEQLSHVQYSYSYTFIYRMCVFTATVYMYLLLFNTWCIHVFLCAFLWETGVNICDYRML